MFTKLLQKISTFLHDNLIDEPDYPIYTNEEPDIWDQEF
jgi:hypothetical protein